MNYILILIALLLTAPDPNESHTIALSDGLKFDVYRVDLKQSDIKLYRQAADGTALQSIEAVKKHLKKEGKSLFFATNGGMYRPDYTPEGLYVENGETQYLLNMEAQGRLDFMNFYNIAPNGVFYITEGNKAGIVPRGEYLELARKKKIKYATQSGPMLVIDGKHNSHFKASSKSKFVRTGVGITKEGKLMFAISHKPVTFYDFHRIFDYYGCKNALYLDGAISEMYLPRLKRTETKRKFASIIAVAG